MGCRPCPAESYGSDGACKECDAGEYQPEQGKAFCERCGRGTVQELTGGTRCEECRAGGYCKRGVEGGFMTFTPCPIGTYGSQPREYSASACVECPDGELHTEEQVVGLYFFGSA